MNQAPEAPRTVRVPSRKTPGVFYDVVIGLDGALQCNCPASFNKLDCWHLKFAGASLAGWEKELAALCAGRTTEVIEFWTNVSAGEGCWKWRNFNGWSYGYVFIDGQRRRATHFAYELANGPIPKGLWVLHRCDNPPCVRPSHLFLGTAKDNYDDMVAKGRRGVQSRRPGRARSHCPKGHPYDPDHRNVRGTPVCLVCQREHTRSYRERVGNKNV